jgi:WD40 repeat protein
MIHLRSSAFLCGLFLLASSPALAQREPVLKQIKLPHNYYYREMYLPQVTSGPSSVAWSPDGKELVVAMQGSLWAGSVPAAPSRTMNVEQITTGAYDHQPDWSPDGRRIVYASYRSDAVDLWVVDRQTMDAHPLVANGAVNVEPHWSPDGKSIAFVSTSYEGRWHIFLIPIESGMAAGPAVRLTEDRDSGLPRYYYSRFDHYLSPTWSPDSRELILVSNHGKIWGTGGFWRMPATPGAPLRPLYDEETTWKARPAWSPDGRRVVYSSYLGRQWNQLWLMTADGGDPLQLTYGDFDATNPRWSPDGRRIAYISNEGGNTSLWMVDVPGGARTGIEIGKRTYRERVGRLKITVVDAATGRELPARVSVSLPDGRSVAPDDAWRHADDAFDRQERSYEYGYFHNAGTSTLTMPAGDATIEVTHGPEYRVYREKVSVAGDQLTARLVRLDRLVNLRTQGWTSGDLHVHMNYGGNYRATPATLAFQARAEGLNVVENLIVNKEDRIPDVSYFSGRLDPVSRPDLLIAHDQEYHTSVWGHTGLLGLTKHLVLPGYAGYAGTPAASLFPDNSFVAEQGHRQGALFGYVHPFDEYPDPSDTATALTNALPIDAGLGNIDYMEIVGFSDHLTTARVWYQLLNCGFRIPAGAGTDAMTNFASLRGPLGTDRVFVRSPVPLDHSRWLAALKAGKSMATNGPLVSLKANGAEVGQEVKLPAGGGEVRFEVWLRSYVPVDHLQLIGNGEVVADLPLSGDHTAKDTVLTLRVKKSGWYTLRAYADRAIPPVLDLYPFGTTSPIYLTVGGVPPRDQPAAEYFIAWLDRLDQAARASEAWNSEEELQTVLGRIQKAREEFEKRR